MHTYINTRTYKYIHNAYINVYIEDVPITTFLARYLARKVPAKAGFLGDKAAPTPVYGHKRIIV